MKLSSLKEKLFDYFSSLSERERWVVLVGVPLLALIVYTFAVLIPLEELVLNYKRKRELVEKKFTAIEPQLKELVCLKKKIDPIEEKLKRGTNLDVPSFIQTVARMVGLSVKDVKVMPGQTRGGYERDVVTVRFKEAEINRVTRFISVLENGSYYFRADGITITDYDENGLVSGKVTLFFYRRSSEG